MGGLIIALSTCSISSCTANASRSEQHPEVPGKTESVKEPAINKKETIKKVMIIGDSMTGWLAERLNAYGQKNGFEVATIVWDGSTISKWGNSSQLASLIKKQNPDAVMVCLGLNELFEKNPESRLKGAYNEIMKAIGDRDVLWIGPPSWPGHSEGKVMIDWLSKQLGDGNYFNSYNLSLPRQSKTNPHPSRTGIIKWMDEIVQWIPEHSNLNFQSLDKPGPTDMSRGKYFLYKRMKETL